METKKAIALTDISTFPGYPIIKEGEVLVREDRIHRFRRTESSYHTTDKGRGVFHIPAKTVEICQWLFRVC